MVSAHINGQCKITITKTDDAIGWLPMYTLMMLLVMTCLMVFKGKAK